jgi:hypothetical protein
MRLSTWVILGFSAAYWADVLLSNGTYGAVAISLVRNVAHGVLLGLARFT